ncbi:hypothetical protein L1987_72814 [Smallanthus sonchifolius]|uniref:Uncharacterized protein n=1 Tax=Smallanthus sonchifolius TaxID=185202 RepID=A0ACB9AVG5_9ASTR|nr:hypothetical protein L1987_72814 [Smallanthus sonchifolius]
MEMETMRMENEQMVLELKRKEMSRDLNLFAMVSSKINDCNLRPVQSLVVFNVMASAHYMFYDHLFS